MNVFNQTVLCILFNFKLCIAPMVFYCQSNAMHNIGQSIKSPERPSVRACVQHLRRHIFITVQDRRMVTMDHP